MYFLFPDFNAAQISRYYILGRRETAVKCKTTDSNKKQKQKYHLKYSSDLKSCSKLSQHHIPQ